LSKQDYYQILGVEKTASDDDLKSAFRKKAKTCHPDLHPDDKAKEAQFKDLNEAYEVLSDADKRAKYDQFGHAAFDQTAGGGNPFTGGGFGGFHDFTDIFGSIFGGGFGGAQPSRNAPMAGEDLRYNLTISFEDAAFGVAREINVTREEICETCAGSGAKPDTKPTRCTTCNGTGQVHRQQNTILGSFSSSRPCQTCGGTGKIISDPCETCKGAGRVRKSARIAVNIPAGIDDGQTLNLRGEGEAGYKGGPRGNLYVTIRVRPHKIFARRGFDLLLDLRIPYTVAALGGEIVVPTLKEQVKYTVPAGTQNNTTFRLRDQGVQRLNASGKGDLFVTVTVDVPTKLTPEQRGLLEQYAALSNETIQTKAGGKKGFFKK